MEVTAPQGTTVQEAANKLSALLNPKEETQEPDSIPTEVTASEGTEPEVTPEAQEEPVTYKVKVDGEEVEVPLDELLKGYSRTSDYTRKTQQIAEQRKAAEAEAEAARVEREQYKQGLEALKSQIMSVAEPDWDRLMAEDPIEFVKQKELFRDRKEKLAALQAEQYRVSQRDAAEQQKRLAQIVSEEQAKLVTLIPEWSDSTKAKAEKEKIVEYGLSIGFSQEELNSLYDSRAVLALRQGMLYRDMVANAKVKKENVKVSPTAKPGTLKPNSQARTAAEAKERLRASGKEKDFADAFKTMFLKQ
ncbi:conserved hypothetical protein [sediment metagenome]|uniref:Scaffolding protein n=1 Tax=sediment metagenome TaxID=749907 RepID=D9PID8_9ZZZZ